MDIKLDNTGDIDFSSGDLSLTDGTSQHATDLIIQAKGENKASPMFGVGVRDYLLSENNGDYLRDTRIQLQKLGMKVNDIGIVDGQLQVDASYVNSENR
jgi:hypothetical protein